MSATRQHQTRAADPASLALMRTIDAMSEQAIRFLAPGRVEAMARQFLSHVVKLARPEDYSRLHADTMMFAVDVALCVPSASGATAFDRLARGRTDLNAVERTAITALRRGRHCLARVDGTTDRGEWRLHDLASHATITLPQAALPARPEHVVGVTILARIAAMGDGTHVLAGPPTPLDDAALAVARGFIRSGAATLANTLRCAEAVYRHVLRHGTLQIPGLSASSEDTATPPPAAAPEPQPIDRIAEAWALLGENAEPAASELQEVREMAVQSHVLYALRSAVAMREARRSRLSDSYARMARVMIETMSLRAATGSASNPLDGVAAALDALIAQRHAPQAVRTLFDSLRLGVRAAPASGTAPDDAGFERLVQRIRALRAKTVEHGCTEAEALAAAEKVAELLDRHGLSLSEIDLRRQRCEGIGIATDRRRRAPIDDCVGTIGAFFDCRVWVETSPTGTLHYVFFGLPGDVQAAEYLYEMVERAFESETEKFRAGTFYQDTPTSHRRSATNSFQIGMARGICAKLDTLRQAREVVMRDGSGRELVPIKEALINADLAKLGLSFRTVNRPGRRSVISDAYDAGQEAGQRFEYRAGLSHAAAA
jgi:hypothetical protein